MDTIEESFRMMHESLNIEKNSNEAKTHHQNSKSKSFMPNNNKTLEMKNAEIESIQKIEKRFLKIQALWKLAQEKNVSVIRDVNELKTWKHKLFVSKEHHTCNGLKCEWLSTGNLDEKTNSLIDEYVVDPLEVVPPGQKKKFYKGTGNVYVCSISGNAHICKREIPSCQKYIINRASEIICSVSGSVLGTQFCSSTPYGRSLVSDGSNSFRGEVGDEIIADLPQNEIVEEFIPTIETTDKPGELGIKKNVQEENHKRKRDSYVLPESKLAKFSKPPSLLKSLESETTIHNAVGVLNNHHLATTTTTKKLKKGSGPQSKSGNLDSIESFELAFLSGKLKSSHDTTESNPEYGRHMILEVIHKFTEVNKTTSERIVNSLMFHPEINKLLFARHLKAENEASLIADKYCAAMVNQGCAPRREMIMYIYYQNQRALLNQTLIRVGMDYRLRLSFVQYFQEAMLKIFAIVSCTPYAKEHSRVSLSGIALAIMYKLRDGLHMSVTYDSVTSRVVLSHKLESGKSYKTESIEFIPAHEMLHCMPEPHEIRNLQIDELRNTSLMKSQKILMEYYSSIRSQSLHIEQVRQYCLSNYMNLVPDIGRM